MGVLSLVCVGMCACVCVGGGGYKTLNVCCFEQRTNFCRLIAYLKGVAYNEPRNEHEHGLHLQAAHANKVTVTGDNRVC